MSPSAPQPRRGLPPCRPPPPPQASRSANTHPHAPPPSPARGQASLQPPLCSASTDKCFKACTQRSRGFLYWADSLGGGSSNRTLAYKARARRRQPPHPSLARAHTHSTQPRLPQPLSFSGSRSSCSGRRGRGTSHPGATATTIWSASGRCVGGHSPSGPDSAPTLLHPAPAAPPPPPPGEHARGERARLAVPPPSIPGRGRRRTAPGTGPGPPTTTSSRASPPSPSRRCAATACRSPAGAAPTRPRGGCPTGPGGGPRTSCSSRRHAGGADVPSRMPPAARAQGAASAFADSCAVSLGSAAASLRLPLSTAPPALTPPRRSRETASAEVRVVQARAGAGGAVGGQQPLHRCADAGAENASFCAWDINQLRCAIA